MGVRYDVAEGIETLPERAAERALGLFVETLGEEALDTMLDVAPEDSGDLKDGLKLLKTGRFERLIVGEAPHTEGVLRGTGLYGPRRERIKPRRAKALRFPWDAIGGKVAIFKGDLRTPQEKARFAAWAEERDMVPFFVWPAGQKPQNFAGRTLDVEQPRLDTYLGEAAAITKRSFG